MTRLARTETASPIMAMGRRISAVINQADAAAAAGSPRSADVASDSACELAQHIVDLPLQTVADAAILLMATSALFLEGDLHDDGTYSYEHGDIIVRRVARFLASQAGIDPADYGAGYLLHPVHREALAHEGTVAEAARRLNQVDAKKARERQEEWRAVVAIQHLVEQRAAERRAVMTASSGGAA